MKREKDTPFVDIGFSKVDLARRKRRGYPEVIFCHGKKPQHVVEIAKVLVANDQPVLATKASKKIYRLLKKEFKYTRYSGDAKLVMIGRMKKNPVRRTILVISAGTADIPIAEEAALTAEFMGNNVERLYDVGVAGLDRLLSNLNKIRKANVLIVVAGMEGALPSVVSGLTDKPVIAVPTKIGYGAHFRGIAPLLTMMNSCSPGIVVVNIDNGFGAGYFASMINRK